ncbi:MAG: hypothetical protein PHS17_16260 [Desulfobacterales bacterium]|nr:hypothetical protein [Desulfobacterales bacterium]
MDLVDAIKTKLVLVDKQVESAWRSDCGALHEQIQPQNRRTVAKFIKAFPPITVALIHAKAAAMMAVMSEVLVEFEGGLPKEDLEALRRFILSYFDDTKYLERMKSFLEAVARKFSSMGMSFRAAEWRTDLLASIFEVSVKNTLLDMCASIEADLTIIAVRSMTDTETGPSAFSSINQCLELKPNFFGIGVNLNEVIQKLIAKFRKDTQLDAEKTRHN